MGLKWVDSLDIAIELNDKFPDVDPMHVNFVDLRNRVLELDDFCLLYTSDAADDSALV